MWTTVFQSVLCLALVHFWIKHRLSYWKRMGVCSVKPKYLLGNMKKFWKRPFCDLTTECYQKLKRKDVIGGFYCFLRPMLILMDPNLIHHVLVKDVAYFPSRGLYCNTRDEPETVNLLTIEGHSQKWKELRAKITPTLTDTSKLKPLFDRMAQVGLEFENHVAQLKQGRPIEVRELCSKYAMDVIGKCAFGEEVNSFKDKDNTFRKMGRRLADQSTVVKRMKMIFVDVFGELSRALGVRVVDETSIKFFKRLITDKVEKRKGKDTTSDMINSLLDTDEEEDTNKELVVGKLTFEEFCAQSLLFFTGHGFEATAATMAWCIYELGMSETVQDKLIDEVDTVLRRHEANCISYEAIQEMTYLDQVLQETLRKHPISPTLRRMTSADYHVPDSTHIITKGTLVLVPVHAIHYDSEYYAEPEEFRPERFSEAEVAKRPPFTFLPFGGVDGPRACIGMRFAMLQIKVGLVLLLRKYRLGVNGKTKEPIKINTKSPLSVPKSSIWMDLREGE